MCLAVVCARDGYVYFLPFLFITPFSLGLPFNVFVFFVTVFLYSSGLVVFMSVFGS